MSKYYDNLIQRVIDNSTSNNWNEAVLEWDVIDCIEDNRCLSSCICGKEEIKYLFTIKNRINRKTLFPIGSSCIRKFQVEELNDEVRIWEQEYNLLHAIERNEFITLKGGLFSRKLLKRLYDENVFKPSSYNNNVPYNDYKFLLDMFNKKEITEKQEKRCKAIIINVIKPYMKEKLKIKNKTN